MKNITAKFIKGITGPDPILSDGLPQVAFIGRSNVGKSSIINSLVNSKVLVKVSPRPGKTTEINFFKINGAFYLVDLPGYGYARTGPAEREQLLNLILWYLKSSGVQSLEVVLILDVKAGLTNFDEEIISVLQHYKHSFVIVANKIDKLNQKELAAQLKQIHTKAGDAEVVPCSTVTEGGINKLEDRLFERAA